MTPETLTALKESIQHWKENASIADINDARVWATHCALCREFNTPEKKADRSFCTGCPVMIKTGQKSCRDTPYQQAADMAALHKDLNGFIPAAEKMATFLESLLPEGEK